MGNFLNAPLGTYIQRIALTLCVLLQGEVSRASTVMLATNDASVVTAFGKAGQGWWSLNTPNVGSNTNYTTGTSFSVSPGMDFSYRSFFTFDLDSPLLAGQQIVAAVLKLQLFQVNGPLDGDQISFFDVSTRPCTHKLDCLRQARLKCACETTAAQQADVYFLSEDGSD